MRHSDPWVVAVAKCMSSGGLDERLRASVYCTGHIGRSGS